MMRREPAISRLGRIVAEGEDRVRGKWTLIRLLTGVEQRWENAMFIKVLESPYIR